MISSISAVSFGSGQASSTQALLQRDGKYARKPSQVVAQSTEKPKKEMSAGVKALIGLVIVALGTAAYLGYAVKNGKLEKIATPEGISDRMKNLGYTVGDTVKGWGEAVAKFFRGGDKAAK